MVIFFVADKLLSFALSYLLTAKNVSVFSLGFCQVLVVRSVAVSFRLSKVRSLIEWLLSSPSICRKKPMFRIWNSFSSSSDVDVLLRAILSYNIKWCALHPLSDSDFLYSSQAYHRESIVGWPPCFTCRVFLSICFAWWYMLCLSEAPCLATRLLFFFYLISRD